jgi:hypothetical protein
MYAEDTYDTASQDNTEDFFLKPSGVPSVAGDKVARAGGEAGTSKPEGSTPMTDCGRGTDDCGGGPPS